MRPVWLTAALVACATPLAASNAGFKLRKPLHYSTSTSNNNWVSFPTYWWPNGQVGTPQSSVDACLALNEGRPGAPLVSQVIRFQTDQDRSLVQSCKSPIVAFQMVPGEGYSVKPAGPGVSIHILGAHDDGYSPNKGGTKVRKLVLAPSTSSGNHWIAVPYHAKAVNGLDVCRELNGRGAGLNKIIAYNAQFDVPRSQPCTSPIKAFDLVPGEAYSVKSMVADAPISFDTF